MASDGFSHGGAMLDLHREESKIDDQSQKLNHRASSALQDNLNWFEIRV
jgi:hypothetical protein